MDLMFKFKKKKNQNVGLFSIIIACIILISVPASAYTNTDQSENFFTFSGINPSISIDLDWDEGSYINGFVTNADLNNNYITCYIKVDNLWWGPKPYWDSPFTIIKPDGTFTLKYVTGGNDQDASIIVVFLIPKGYRPPSLAGANNLPEELDKFLKTSSYRLVE